MSDHKFREHDFEHPSILFLLEDELKGLIGGPLLYNPYFKNFGLEGDEKILDFGCGGGAGSRCLANLLNQDGHLTCVDISSYWIRKARKKLEKYSNVECEIGDIRKMNMPDFSFDVISIIHVIHDIDPADRQDTVSALSQKLKGKGTLFIRERTQEPHGMPVDEIRTLLSGAGLKEIEHKVSKSEYMGKYQKVG